MVGGRSTAGTRRAAELRTDARRHDDRRQPSERASRPNQKSNQGSTLDRKVVNFEE